MKLAGEDEEKDAKHCGEFEEMDFAHLEGAPSHSLVRSKLLDLLAAVGDITAG